MAPRQRNIVIIVGIALLAALGFALYMFTNNATTTPESGGSGEPEPGTLILRNMDALTDDGDAIPLGSFLTTDQQATIQDQLQAVLYLKQEQSTYMGTVVDRSVVVNYETNDISFTVHIDDPNSDYKVTINTVTDVLRIEDKDGKKVN